MTKRSPQPEYAYFRGAIVPFEQATVSIMTHALHYGTAVFGGLRGYWNADEAQLFLFRPNEHFERLIQSASLMRIKLDKSPEELTEILRQLLQMENIHEDCYIRPLAYKSTPTIGVRLHDIEDDFTMAAFPFGSYVDGKEETGLHVCFSAWRRVDDNAIPARGKVSGAYANSSLIKSDAILSGYDEALVLTNDGHLSEGSAANIMMVRKGALITPPITSDLLEGITRRSLIEIARDYLGLEVIERDIDRTEVYIADELFFCGTGVQIAAITQVEHRQIGTGKIGSITRRLHNAFHEVVNGRVAEYRHWLTPVYTEEPVTV
jgi:branched-chain amino acid aminotransferase